MCKRANRWGIAVAVAFSVGLIGVAGVAEGKDQAAVDAFQRGMTLYQTGDYAGARKAFDEVLAADLSLEDALAMRDKAELGEMLEMTAVPEMRQQAADMMDLLKRAGRQGKRAIADPGKLVEDFKSQELDTYGLARIAMVGHGPYIVPYVVELLGLTDAEQQYIVPRTASLLTELHADACLPLVEALINADSSLLQARAAEVLGQIGDGRAVPALMAVAEDAGSAKDAAAAAKKAVLAITGQQPAALGSAAQQYLAYGMKYFDQIEAEVGYTYGMSADVWKWNPAGTTMADRIVYEDVPNYLYYQRMATELALEGLSHDPGNADLQALLAASFVRQMALCEFFRSADARLGGLPIDAAVKQDAQARAAAFAVEAPVVLRMLAAPVLAQALDLALSASDGPSGLYLVKTIGDKLAASGPGALCEKTAASLTAALDSGDKDVRYNAGIVLVQAGPAGNMAPAADVVSAMGAALAVAADRTALVVLNDFSTRNELVNLLEKAGLATTECSAVDANIEYALSLEPSVDIIFLSVNVSEGLLDRMMKMIKSDVRTKGAALYLVRAAGEVPDLTAYTMDGILTLDDLRPAKLDPIAQEVLSESRSAFTDDEEALVLKATKALEGVDPTNTAYPLAQLEEALLKCLTGYSDEVTAAVIGALANFGSGAAADPLGRTVADNPSLDLRIAAARALSAVLKRNAVPASEETLAVLKDAVSGDEQALREAAAEALGSAGLTAADMLVLVRTAGMGEK